MPAKAKSNRNNGNLFDVVFVNVKIDIAEEGKFNAWTSRKDGEVAFDIAKAISDGHKIGLSWDSGNACFIVSATCKDDASINYNHCISSRSDDWYEALMMTVYKVQVMLADKAWSSGAERSNWG